MLPNAFPMGPFIVQDGGRLTLRVPGGNPGFSFAWRRRSFSAVLQADAVMLRGVLGQVPSSLSYAERRPPVFAALACLPQGHPPGWSFHLAPDHRLEVAAREELEWPATASGLLQPLVRFILALSPTLDFLDEVGF